MQKKWTKETVFEESKKYSSRSEFKKKEIWCIPYCVYERMVGRNDMVGASDSQTYQMD